MTISAVLTSLCLFIADIPTVDSQRLELAKSSDRMFFWLVISSIVVGIGVVLEAPGEIHEFRRWLKLWRLNKTKSWFRPLAFFGLIVVTAGILGEGIFEYLSSDAETQVRTFDEQILSQTIEKAEGAKRIADDATVEANTAKQDSGTALANSRAADGLATSASMSAQAVAIKAEELDRKAALVDAQLIDVESKRKELQTFLVNAAICTAPRVLPWRFVSVTGSPPKSSLDILRGYNSVAILVTIPDPESYRAEASLKGALESAGWTVLRQNPKPDEPVLDGVRVMSYNLDFDPTHSSEAAALAVTNLLHSYNWYAVLWRAPTYIRDMPPNSVRIEIGLYPPTNIVDPPALAAMDADVAEVKRLGDEMWRKAIREEGDIRARTAPPGMGEAAKKAYIAKATDTTNEDEYKRTHGGVQPCKAIDPLKP